MTKKKASDTGPSVENGAKEESHRRLISRLIDSGLELLISTGDDDRTIIKPLALPKEVINYFINQIDRSKSEIVSLFGREFKRFLDATDLGDEVSKAMDHMTVEVKAEFKFRRKPTEEIEAAEADTNSGRGEK